MSTASITLTVKVAPWVRWYISGVALFAKITGLTPDPDKVAATCMRGIRIKAG
ncbi:MAG: hypothetical protein WC023_06570 [Rhodocyclaceae bacterium]